MTSPRTLVTDPCPPDEHDISESAFRCGRCGVVLCDICGSDEHFTGDGHDLSNPRYWGV